MSARAGEGAPSAWPPVPADRLADAVVALAGRIAEPDVRAQLHALSGVLRNLGAEGAGADARDSHERALAAALRDEDERGVLEALRRLSAVNRGAVVPVDWSAASGG